MDFNPEKDKESLPAEVFLEKTSGHRNFLLKKFNHYSKWHRDGFLQ